jgi:hypothetical protein
MNANIYLSYEKFKISTFKKFNFYNVFPLQSREKMMKGVRRGCVRLRGALIGIDDQDLLSFTITVDHKTFHFQVSSTLN